MIVVAGSLNMDLVAQVEQLPQWGQTMLGADFATFAGGKGGNQAVAAARLGAPVVFAGAVGDDDIGAALRQSLRDAGIGTDAVVQVPGASGCALIHVGPSGDNAITVLPGANRLAPLPPAAWPQAWRFVLLQLEIPLQTTLAWAQAARRAGAQVLLNAAPMASLPAALLSKVDWLIVNEGELRQLVGEQPSIDSGLAQAARLGPRAVVVTLGADGAAAWIDGRLLRWPGRAVTVVDSTGAGDTFVGALAAGLHQGRSMDDVLTRANAAAALSCMRPGARGGMPSTETLERWLADPGADRRR